MNRRVIACQYCGMYVALRTHDIHEQGCESNPASTNTFRAGTGLFMRKRLPVRYGETPLNTVTVFFDWSPAQPMLRDDAFYFLKKGWLQRNTAGGFFVGNTPSDEALDAIWEGIDKAKQMGAK